MSEKERERFYILTQVQEKRMSQMQAAQVLGITDRQIRKLLKRLEMKGVEGICSKKEGKRAIENTR